MKKAKETLYMRDFNKNEKKKSRNRLKNPINIFQRRKDL